MDARGTDGAVERVVGAFRDRFGDAPAAHAVAPGRVNLVGGHVDYNDGLVLPVVIDRATVAAARPREDGVLRVRTLTLEDEVAVSVGEVPGGWGAYVAGTAAVLAEAADADVGADLVVGGDMIVGAGLSSSAALELAVAGALDAVHGLGLDRERLAELCWRAENEEVGMACGIMDQLTCAVARAGHALRLDCRTREVEHVPIEDRAARLLVVDTNVKHELTDSKYNERVSECHEAVAQLDAVLDKRVGALRDVTPGEVEAHADDLAPTAHRRARHVTTEIERVEAAVGALREGDVERVGALMRESHRSLREDYAVSCAELDAVVGILDDRPGVFGARMVGGGWGGSVVALVAPGAAEDVAAAVTDRYAAETGIEGDVYTVDVGGGLRVAAGPNG
ncbi:MAG: galactokinase [Halobacteriales archaeon]